MTKAEKYQELILQTNEWFKVKKKQLEILIDKKDEAKIIFKNGDGEEVELPEEMKKGFHFGIQTAIEVLGEFPIVITRNNDSN